MTSKDVGCMGKVMQMDRTYRETTVAAVITGSKAHWHRRHRPHPGRPVQRGPQTIAVLVGGDIRPRVIEALQFIVGKLKSECVTEQEIYE